MNKFSVFCQKVTPHYINESGVLECCDCKPLRESDYESDSSSEDPTNVPDSD